MWIEKTKPVFLLVACVLAGAAIACGDGTPIDDPLPDPDPDPITATSVFSEAPVGFAIELDPASTTVTGAAAYTLTLTAVETHVAGIALDLPTAITCAEVSGDDITDTATSASVVGACASDSLSFAGSEVFALLDDDWPLGFADLAIPVGSYDGIALDLSPAAETETAALGVYSLVAYGSYVTETTTAVRFALTLGDSLSVSAAAAVSLTTDGNADFVVTIDGDAWLAAIADELASCLDATDTTFTDTLDFDSDVTHNTECDAVEAKLVSEFAGASNLTLRARSE